MSDSVILALIGFRGTLEDSTVKAETKLHVLGTLNEVNLTLDELSDSGVGRAVKSLKHAPGELGRTARLLLSKWKKLLRSHMIIGSLSQSDDNVLHEAANGPVSCSQSPIDVPLKETVVPDPKKLRLPEQRQSPVLRLNETGELLEAISIVKQPLSPDPVPSGSLKAPRSPSSVTREYNKKTIVKQKRSLSPESIDSSSGMSFIESLSVGSVPCRSKKKKVKSAVPKLKSVKHLPESLSLPTSQPSATFTKEILSSLSEDVDRPDIIHRPANKTTVDSFDDEDGNLKFKSKKVLWVPKALRPCHELGGPPHDPSDPIDVELNVSSLVELCLDVIERNLGRVDQVGQVPYELLARPLSHASPEDLARIERCNPHFLGCSDDLWQRHIQRSFQGLKETRPRPNETWCAFYERLSREESNRLNRIINQSARKIKQEQENRRTTLTTEVITPRQIQRRVARQHGSQSLQQKSHSGRPSSTPSSNPATVTTAFRPYNVSRPPADASAARNHIAPLVSHITAPSSSSGGGGGGGGGGNLLDKLRKQFRSGRLR